MVFLDGGQPKDVIEAVPRGWRGHRGGERPRSSRRDHGATSASGPTESGARTDRADRRSARTDLAAAYQQAGRLSDAIHRHERALAGGERMLGPTTR
jgi:hypothetical protein